MTTIMQRLQCDLQPQIQETYRTTHTGTATRCRTQRRNPLRPERPQPQPPHTQGSFHRRLQPLYTEKIQGFVLRLPPQNTAHATCMQPLQYVAHHPVANLHLSTRMATPDDNNHAAMTRVYCFVMSSLKPQTHTTLHWVYCYVMPSLTPQSHTTLHWVYCYR